MFSFCCAVCKSDGKDAVEAVTPVPTAVSMAATSVEAKPSSLGASGPGADQPPAAVTQTKVSAAAPLTKDSLKPLARSRGGSRQNLGEGENDDARSQASTAKNSTRSSHASTIGSEFVNEQIPALQADVARMQSQMKSFVKGMVRGREMNVLSVDGQLRSCTCSFDRKLKEYKIMISKDTRSIPLTKFREVFQGAEPEDIATPLDELCVTVVLDTGECLSFRFNSVEERESFAMCLQIIMDGHQ